MSRSSRPSGRRSVAAGAVATLVVATVGAAATTAASASPTLTPTAVLAASAAADHPELAPLSRPFAMPGFKEQELDGLSSSARARPASGLGRPADQGRQGHQREHGAEHPEARTRSPPMGRTTRSNSRPTTASSPTNASAASGQRSTIPTAGRPPTWPMRRRSCRGLQAKYDAMQAGKRNVVVKYARVSNSELVGSVTALDDDTSVWIDASAPWLEPSTYAVAGPSSLTGSSAGVRELEPNGPLPGGHRRRC